MLLRANRLRKKRDFEKVFKEGEGFQEKFLFLKLRENEKEESRIGFVIPKKYFRKAVLRNKLKRRLREQVRKKLPQIKKGYDIVMVGREGLEKMDFWETDEMLEKLLFKAGVFTK